MKILYMNQGGGGPWGAIKYSVYNIILLAESKSPIDEFRFDIAWESKTQPAMSIHIKNKDKIPERKDDKDPDKEKRILRTITKPEDLDDLAKQVRPIVTFTTVGDCDIRVVFVHLKSGNEAVATEAIDAAVKALKEKNLLEKPLLWIGDFNRAGDASLMNLRSAEKIFEGGGYANWRLDRAYISGDWSDYVYSVGNPSTAPHDHGHMAIEFDFTRSPENRKKRISYAVDVTDGAANKCARVVGLSADVGTRTQKTRKSIGAIKAGVRNAGAIPSIHDKTEDLLKNLNAVDAQIGAVETKAKPCFDFCAVHKRDAQVLAEACHTLAKLLHDNSEQRHIEKKEHNRQGSRSVGLHSGDDAAKIIIDIAKDDLLLQLQTANDLFAKMPDPIIIENALRSIDSHLADIAKTIDPMMKPLKDIEDLLDKKITVSIPIPLFGRPSVSIACSTILQGANTIENEIKKAIGDTAWRVLKKLGVGEVVKKFQEPAEDALKAILGRLDLDVKIPVDMPSLPDSLPDFQSVMALALMRIEVRLP